ncbi:Protein of unknown function, partial [Gryllus bimaculatus]
IPSPSCLPCQSNYANNSDDNVLHRKENGNIVIQGRIGEKLQNIMFALIILKNVALKRMENYEVKDEGDRTYPSREAMEDDDEDPLAMCNENLFGDSALPVGGEYETVRDILGSRSQIRNGVCSTPPLIDGNYIALGKTKVKGSESPVRKDQAAENESQFPKLNTAKREGDRTYPSREAMEEDDEEEIKPPFEVFLNPEEVPIGEVKQEQKDPLAMCNENLFGDSALPVGGECGIVGDTLDSKAQIRNAFCTIPLCNDGNYQTLDKRRFHSRVKAGTREYELEHNKTCSLIVLKQCFTDFLHNMDQIKILSECVIKIENVKQDPDDHPQEEDNNFTELKPPIRVFLCPEEAPGGGATAAQEDEDPLAVGAEPLRGEREQCAGGEYETVRDILGSRTHIRNGGCSTPPRIDGNYIALGKTKLWELMELVTYSVYAEEELKPRVAAAALAVGVQRADLPVPDRHLADRLRHLQEHGVPGRRRHAVAVALQSRAGAVLHTGGSQLLL